MTNAKSISQLNPEEIRDFVSPRIIVAKGRKQLIFALRFGFNRNPGNWLQHPRTQQALTNQNVETAVSNSTCDSGEIVTAGYILFKAPNTTHRQRYTQYLRSKLPEATPFFDLVRMSTTPMDQKIPHLVIKCGEKHVAPLCQALLHLLTGYGTTLFLPRYALGT